MNLFVAKLSSSTTDGDLQKIFSAYGEVSSAKVIIDRDTGRSKCFGFVEMTNQEEGNAAMEPLNESEVDGNQIAVKEANPREERPRRDNRGDGGSYNRNGGDRGGYGGGSGGGNRW